ncbi:MAG: hypothetical protein ACE5G0_16400, partial [Rhodothermales bacterium]
DLPHVVDITWPHDGERSINTFLQSPLEVIFDRPVTPATTRGSVWFVVTLEQPVTDPAETLQIQPVPVKSISLTGNQATFVPGGGTRAMMEYYFDPAEPILCRIILKCDFLTDANGLAVDGNHIGGVLPSGNGIQGGIFESWFILNG